MSAPPDRILLDTIERWLETDPAARFRRYWTVEEFALGIGQNLSSGPPGLVAAFKTIGFEEIPLLRAFAQALVDQVPHMSARWSVRIKNKDEHMEIMFERGLVN